MPSESLKPVPQWLIILAGVVGTAFLTLAPSFVGGFVDVGPLTIRQAGQVASSHLIGLAVGPLLEQAGKPCPAKPVAEIRYTTKPLPGILPNMPLLIFSDYGFYIREERGGLLIGGGDPSPAPADRHIDPLHPPTVDKLHQEQAYRVRQHIKVIEDLMPALKQAEIDRIAGGIPTFTDDVHFIADAVPGQQGLFVISACQEAGITHGPGLGLLMSELVTGARPSFDRDAFRLSRFATQAASG